MPKVECIIMKFNQIVTKRGSRIFIRKYKKSCQTILFIALEDKALEIIVTHFIYDI